MSCCAQTGHSQGLGPEVVRIFSWLPSWRSDLIFPYAAFFVRGSSRSHTFPLLSLLELGPGWARQVEATCFWIQWDNCSLKAADWCFASWYLWTTVFTTSSGEEIGHQVICLPSSWTASGPNPSPWSICFSRFVWYACRTTMVCRDAPAWPASAHALPTKIVTLQGFVGKAGFPQASLPPSASLLTPACAYWPLQRISMRPEYAPERSMDCFTISTPWSGKNGRWQRGGCTRAELRKQLSSLSTTLLAYHSAKTIFNLATARITTPQSQMQKAWVPRSGLKNLQSELHDPERRRAWEIGYFLPSQTLPLLTQLVNPMTKVTALPQQQMDPSSKVQELGPHPSRKGPSGIGACGWWNYGDWPCMLLTHTQQLPAVIKRGHGITHFLYLNPAIHTT